MNHHTTPAPWTDTRIEILKTRWAEGASAREIAAELGGVTRSAVCGKVNRMGLKRSLEVWAPNRARYMAAAVQASAEAARWRREQRALAPPTSPKPRLKVSERNQVLVEGPPRPIITPSRADAFNPLPGSQPRPFFERKLGQCKWPIGEGADMRSCCEPAVRSGYCGPHAALCFSAPKPGQPRTGNELARSLRRYV